MISAPAEEDDSGEGSALEEGKLVYTIHPNFPTEE